MDNATTDARNITNQTVTSSATSTMLASSTSDAIVTANVSEMMTDAMTTTTTTRDANTSMCSEGLPWIRDHFGDCIDTTTELFAFSSAMIALGLWLISHLFLLKSRRNNPDCSCNRLLLILLAGVGSVCNLVGATLCDQLGTQILTASYLVFSDLVLFFQWIHWWNRNRKLNKQGLSFYGETRIIMFDSSIHHHELQPSSFKSAEQVASEGWKSPDREREGNTHNGGGNLVLCLVTPWIMTACYWPIRSSFVPSPWQQGLDDHAYVSRQGRKLLMVSDSATDNFGYALGFTALLLSSLCRIPTIVNIARHKTTCTESIWSLVFLIAANACYFISIVAFNTDPTFLTNALPWLLLSISVIIHSFITILIVMRNRGIGTTTRPVGRRRPDGTFLLYPSEESLNVDVDTIRPGGTLRFTDDNGSVKLPSIVEEPHLESHEQVETEATPIEDEFEPDYDAETASIHSRASDFILDDDEDVYVRSEDDHDKSARGRRAADYDDDGLEWDFDDFRPKYTDGSADSDDDIVSPLPSSPNHHHHSLGIEVDVGNVEEDDWDEEKVLSEIEKELRLAEDIDADTISMEYDTADDESGHFDGMQYSYVPNPH